MTPREEEIARLTTQLHRMMAHTSAQTHLLLQATQQATDLMILHIIMGLERLSDAEYAWHMARPWSWRGLLQRLHLVPRIDLMARVACADVIARMVTLRHAQATAISRDKAEELSQWFAK